MTRKYWSSLIKIAIFGLTEQYSVNPQNGYKKIVISLCKWITTPLIKELDNIDPHRSR